MWRELIAEVEPAVIFSEPTTETAIQAAATALSQQLPEDLVSLLRETDGVGGEYQTWLWSHEEIVIRNTDYRRDPRNRELYMPLEPLLFFADAGVDGHSVRLSQPSSCLHRHFRLVSDWGHAELDCKRPGIVGPRMAGRHLGHLIEPNPPNTTPQTKQPNRTQRWR